MTRVVVGTAGWSIARSSADRFPEHGSSLERYAAVFAGTEINSSFHRSHRLDTWRRWRDSTPAAFRFAVKLPKTITHERKLRDIDAPLETFLAEAAELGDKLAVLLVQLPPKLAYEPALAARFFADLAARSTVPVALEPRHPSWFEGNVGARLSSLNVARVAADPAVCPAAAVPGGWGGLAYWRLHGSPAMYRSSYGERIDSLAAAIGDPAAAAEQRWCIFDNTASSAATGDALAFAERLNMGA